MIRFPTPAATLENRTPPSGPVLVVDDIPSLRAIYQACLADAGYRPIAAKSAAEGLDLFHRSGAQIVVLDLFLPDRDGLDLMREMLTLRPGTSVIVVTADLSIDRAVEAMRLGAQDFLVKPVSEERLLNAIAQARGPDESAETSADLSVALSTPGFIGRSSAVRDLNLRLQTLAGQAAPACVWGEEGAGRTLAARMIHMLRPDGGNGPFITVDCASRLAEGSDPNFNGLLQRAAGGTLFLSRITELDLALQAQLAQKMPDTTPRLVFGMAMTPREAAAAGRLEASLADRMQDNLVRVPSLRERREDIGLLARIFLRRYAQQHNRRLNCFSPTAEEILSNQDWPGNVRQLIGVISAIATLHDGEAVTAAMLPVDMLPSDTPPPALPETLIGLTLADIEKIVIEEAIARHEGSVPRVAEELDVAPSTIYRKMGIWRKD